MAELAQLCGLGCVPHAWGGAILLARAMRSLLFGVTPADPLTFVVVPLALIATALLASWLPARAAASIEPTEAPRG